MAIFIPPDSWEGKERAKWDRPRNQTVDGVPGMKNAGYEPYPKVLYRAGRPDHGNVKITGSLTVHSIEQEDVAKGQGWAESQEQAIAAVHDRDTEYAKLAAERAYHERRMSEKAQQEAAAVDSQTVYHVPVIPETPIRRRGRPARKREEGAAV